MTEQNADLHKGIFSTKSKNLVRKKNRGGKSSCQGVKRKEKKEKEEKRQKKKGEKGQTVKRCKKRGKGEHLGNKGHNLKKRKTSIGDRIEYITLEFQQLNRHRKMYTKKRNVILTSQFLQFLVFKLNPLRKN